MKIRLFVDMDGTMTVWKKAASFKSLLLPGFYRQAVPNQPVVDAIRILASDPSLEVFTLSAYIATSHYALDEKMAWLDEHAPYIEAGHRLFCPCGKKKKASSDMPGGLDKSIFIPDGIRATDVLLDDYSFNLHTWKGRGLKLMNGVNGTHGSWTGAKVSADEPAAMLAQKIRAFALLPSSEPTN